MSIQHLTNLLLPRATIQREGIHIAQEIAQRTVWDELAESNPTHAVISAKNEADAAHKSAPQITDIKSFLTTGDIVLDCGTGYGRVAKYLLPSIQLGGYIGVDSAFQMLSLFKERYNRSDTEQKTPVLLVNADIHTVPLSDACADVAIVSAVFLHNHKSVVERAMVEIKRLVKPGGTVLVYSSFPRTMTLMGAQGHLYQFVLNLLGRPFKNGPVRYYRRREIMQLFHGFSKVDLRPVGYAALPKTLIFLPGPLEVVWRRGIANPINTLLEHLTPASLKPYFAVHFDAVAKR